MRKLIRRSWHDCVALISLSRMLTQLDDRLMAQETLPPDRNHCAIKTQKAMAPAYGEGK